MVEKTQEIVKLTEDEIKILQEYQKIIENEKTALGNLYLQFSLSKKNLVSRIEKVQSDFYAHLKVLSQSKNIPITGEWIFDPMTYSFRKK